MPRRQTSRPGEAALRLRRVLRCFTSDLPHMAEAGVRRRLLYSADAGPRRQGSTTALPMSFQCTTSTLAPKSRVWANFGATGADFRKEADFEGTEPIRGTDVYPTPCHKRLSRSEVPDDHRCGFWAAPRGSPTHRHYIEMPRAEPPALPNMLGRLPAKLRPISIHAGPNRPPLASTRYATNVADSPGPRQRVARRITRLDVPPARRREHAQGEEHEQDAEGVPGAPRVSVSDRTTVIYTHVCRCIGLCI